MFKSIIINIVPNSICSFQTPLQEKLICSLQLQVLRLLIWFGLVCWVLWHINLCWLFNAKSSLYIYIKYIGFGLVGFYDISTIVGYLMSNPLYTYISNI